MSKEQPVAWRQRDNFSDIWEYSDYQPPGLSWPLYPASALDAAFRRGLERASEVAESVYGHFGHPVVTRALKRQDPLQYGRVEAGQQIAAAIRALAEKEPAP